MQQLSGAMRILTEISKDRGLAHTTEVGDLFLNPRNYIPDLPTPLAGGQRKIICGLLSLGNGKYNPDLFCHTIEKCSSVYKVFIAIAAQC